MNLPRFALSRFWPAYVGLVLIFLLALVSPLNQGLFFYVHHAGSVLPAELWRSLSALGDWPTAIVPAAVLTLLSAAPFATCLDRHRLGYRRLGWTQTFIRLQLN
jgi:hypothetical protein